MPFTGLSESSFEWSILILGPLLFLITKTTSQTVRSLIRNFLLAALLYFLPYMTSPQALLV